jgi:hypothetical protein
MPRNEDALAVQARLQELFDTMAPDQANILDSVIAGTPREILHDHAEASSEADQASIIIVSGRSGRRLVFDLHDVLTELNPQPLPPGPPDPSRTV